MESSNRLQGLDSRQDTQNVVGYSLIVRGLKLFLPLAALGLIGILLVWPQFKSMNVVPLTQDDVQALKQAETENRLINPVFNTEDSKGTPMTITASEAVQRRSNENIIELYDPAATMNDNQNATTLNAETGEYDKNSNIIRLEKNVTITDSRNNILETQSLTADITAGSARSDVPTKLTTPEGVIEGQGITIENNGAKTTFQGPAKAVIQ